MKALICVVLYCGLVLSSPANAQASAYASIDLTGVSFWKSSDALNFVYDPLADVYDGNWDVGNGPPYSTRVASYQPAKEGMPFPAIVGVEHFARHFKTGYGGEHEYEFLISEQKTLSYLSSANFDYGLSSQGLGQLLISGVGSLEMYLPYTISTEFTDVRESARASVSAHSARVPSGGPSSMSDNDRIEGAPQSRSGVLTLVFTNAGPQSEHIIYTKTLIHTVGVVPEPETYALMGLGLLTLALTRRRKLRGK